MDVIVVYKIDRLSRSLFDFAKLVELLEKGNASFVSITQPINNTTSMGRLTLNMLLSFAQFEREVTAERIRDKIAASKAKGMFMGGVPPVGYRCEGRTLAIVPEHAALVRAIFRRYLGIGNVRRLQEALERERLHTPRRKLDSGRKIGGLPFTCDQLRIMLTSRLYLGEIPYKQHVYPGLHSPIIDRALWDQIQGMLSSSPQGGGRSVYRPSASLLAGKIVDEVGEPLISVHSSKSDPNSETGRKRFSYYVSRALHHGQTSAGMRVPAREVEGLVVRRLAEAFDDPLDLIIAAGLDVPPDSFGQVTTAVAVLAGRIRQKDHDLVRSLLQRVEVYPRAVEIICDVLALEQAVGLQSGAQRDPLRLVIPVRLTRSGTAMRLIEGGRQPEGREDPVVIRLVVQARRYWRELRKGELNISQLADRERVGAPYITRVLRLAFLSPQWVEAVVAGKKPMIVSGAKLLRSDAIDPLWSEQAKTLVA